MQWEKEANLSTGDFWLKGKGKKKQGMCIPFVYPLRITEVVISVLVRLSVCRGYRNRDTAG